MFIDQRIMLEAEFTPRNVKRALWAIEGDKSPGPNGYGSQIFKDRWDIVWFNLVEGVLEFFKNGRMLSVVNNIVITLIPKSSHVETIGDFRPIACCNTVYKVI